MVLPPVRLPLAHRYRCAHRHRARPAPTCDALLRSWVRRARQQSQTHQPHRPSLNYCPSHSICHLYTHFPHRACADNFDASPGVTPERSGVVPMSLTDTALMQLTQSLTSISIGPIGQKRSLEERD